MPAASRRELLRRLQGFFSARGRMRRFLGRLPGRCREVRGRGRICAATQAARNAAISAAKISAGMSTVTRSRPGRSRAELRSGGMVFMSAVTRALAKRAPVTAAIRASWRDSRKRSFRMRAGVAPRAARMAISRRRALARASRRLVALTEAISRSRTGRRRTGLGVLVLWVWLRCPRQERTRAVSSFSIGDGAE